MKFVFLGCPGAEQETTNLGRVWVKDVPQDVDDADHIERLSSHPYWAKCNEALPAPAVVADAAQDASDAPSANEAEVNAFDLPPAPVEAPVKRRGRPPGSKNAVKTED